MKIDSFQKVIKVGSSLAVTIPAKDARYFDVKAGETLKVRFERPEEETPETHSAEVVVVTQKLIQRHKKALDNLVQR
jgi:bifunctional DNA-binding transcriptional regulator/antitoxin component of YhaV-PrlF toxin-antitoxin module